MHSIVSRKGLFISSLKWIQEECRGATGCALVATMYATISWEVRLVATCYKCKYWILLLNGVEWTVRRLMQYCIVLAMKVCIPYVFTQDKSKQFLWTIIKRWIHVSKSEETKRGNTITYTQSQPVEYWDGDGTKDKMAFPLFNYIGWGMAKCSRS